MRFIKHYLQCWLELLPIMIILAVIAYYLYEIHLSLMFAISGALVGSLGRVM